ncbi:hypothetical protein AHMF7605_22545 [Adhaeribacter arboris]|uniref:Uncharacterized protein n=1 Tax=Adhaeribacter arboris TaxID=2072846 RepID=A0A2T2YKP8_9BACT|nr:hypothetical protein [Adhaeribacter arboris]PSR56081.1 hypothetical protein AHMF7605_22545 [Adhaeribacter arboris]
MGVNITGEDGGLYFESGINLDRYAEDLKKMLNGAVVMGTGVSKEFDKVISHIQDNEKALNAVVESYRNVGKNSKGAFSGINQEAQQSIKTFQDLEQQLGKIKLDKISLADNFKVNQTNAANYRQELAKLTDQEQLLKSQLEATKASLKSIEAQYSQNQSKLKAEEKQLERLRIMYAELAKSSPGSPAAQTAQADIKRLETSVSKGQDAETKILEQRTNQTKLLADQTERLSKIKLEKVELKNNFGDDAKYITQYREELEKLNLAEREIESALEKESVALKNNATIQQAAAAAAEERRMKIIALNEAYDKFSDSDKALPEVGGKLQADLQAATAELGVLNRVFEQVTTHANELKSTVSSMPVFTLGDLEKEKQRFRELETQLEKLSDADMAAGKGDQLVADMDRVEEKILAINKALTTTPELNFGDLQDKQAKLESLRLTYAQLNDAEKGTGPGLAIAKDIEQTSREVDELIAKVGKIGNNVNATGIAKVKNEYRDLLAIERDLSNIEVAKLKIETDFKAGAIDATAYAQALAKLEAEENGLVSALVKGSNALRQNADFQKAGKDIIEEETKSLNKLKAVYQNLPQSAKLDPEVGGSFQKDIAEIEKSITQVKAVLESTSTMDGFSKSEQSGQRLNKTMQQLKIELQSYEAIIEKSWDPVVIKKYAGEVSRVKTEMQAIKNVGKEGFDALGRPVKEQLSLMGKLEKVIQIYKRGIATAPSTELITKYNAKLQEAEARLKRMQNIGKVGFDEVGNAIEKSSNKVGGFLGGIKGGLGQLVAGLGIANTIQEVIGFMKRLVSESVELAAKGEGIRTAFKRIGDDNTLQRLREATRGATSDIDLMAAAIRGKNFQIGPELLAKGLELAGKISRQTGQDVTYLTNSFVDGLGRKSIRILDNLQISQVELQKEIKKTGDFQVAVANITERKLQELGQVVDTSADRMARIGAFYQNLKEKIGQGIIKVFNYDGLNEANKAFFDTGQEVTKLQKEFVPLLNRYDELSAKAKANGGVTKLNKQEQQELKDALKRISDTTPGAITAFDNYGNALSANTDKGRDFVKQQVLVLQALNAERIKKTKDRLEELTTTLGPLKKQMDELAKTGEIKLPNVSAGAGDAFGGSPIVGEVYRKATGEEKKAIQNRYRELRQTEAQQRALLAADSGKLLEDSLKAATPDVPEFDSLLVEVDKNFKRLLELVTSKDDLEKIRDAMQIKIEGLAPNNKDIARLQQKLEQVKNLLKVYDPDKNKSGVTNDYLKRYEDMMQKLDGIKSKYASKTMETPEAEIQKVRDEFKNIATDIAQFNRDPKNVLKIKTEGLEELRNKIIDDLTYRQNTEKLGIDAEKLKASFAEYEAFKTQTSKEEADKRFANELKGYENFGQFIQEQIAKIDTSGPMDADIKARLDLYTNLAKENWQNQAKLREQDFVDAYNETISYEQKVLKIKEEFGRKVQALRDANPGGNVDREVELLKKDSEAKIDATNDEYFQRTKIYKKLSEDIIQYSKIQLKAEIAAIKNSLELVKNMAPELKAELQEKLADLEIQIKTRPDKAYEQSLIKRNQEIDKLLAKQNDINNKEKLSVAQIRAYTKEQAKNIQQLQEMKDTWAEFNQMTGDQKVAFLGNEASKLSSNLKASVDLIGLFDKKAAQAVNTVANLVDSAAQIFKGASTMDPAALIAGAAGIMTGFMELMDKSQERQAAYQERQRQSMEKTQAAIEGMNRALEQQAKIIDKALGVDKITAYRNQIGLIKDDILKTIDKINGVDLFINAERGVVEYEAALKKLNDTIGGDQGRPDRGTNSGRDINGNPVVVNPGVEQLESQLDTIDKVIEANRAAINDLYKQMESGRLKGNIDELKALIEQYEGLEGQLESYRAKVQEVVTGTTYSSIVDTMANAFKDMSGPEAFAKNFQELMENAIIQSLKMTALEVPLKKFYDDLAKASESEGGLDKEEIAELQKTYNEIIENAQKQFDDLQQIAGVDFAANKANDANTLKGAIRRELTEETGTLLASQWGAERIVQIEQLEVLKDVRGLVAILAGNPELPKADGTGLIPSEVQGKSGDFYDWSKGLVDGIGNKLDFSKDFSNLTFETIKGNDILQQYVNSLKSGDQSYGLNSPEFIETIKQSLERQSANLNSPEIAQAIKQSAEISQFNSAIFNRMDEKLGRIDENTRLNAEYSKVLPVLMPVIADYLKSMDSKIKAGTGITEQDQLRSNGYTGRPGRG